MLWKVRNSTVWRSFWRQGYPATDENRALIMFNSLFLHLMPVKVRRHTLKITYTWGLGFTAFWLFIILTLTGAVLMFFYVPDVSRAYYDIQRLETEIPFGALFRNTHRWAAHLMVLIVFLHMCRVFYTGGYKQPREWNWVVGVILFVVTLLLSFTGYLLPWDDLGIAASKIGGQIAQTSPFLGKWVRGLLIGVPLSQEVGQQTIIRWYVLHVIVLPLACYLLIFFHFWRIRKDGGISHPVERPSSEEK
ncbi:MAG: cytochrome b N-terminal domain-containing protein [Chloroflexi bacterium]|nr:cytochrome b N-terminal domain-containing protein [Chloroflexota bacterium]